jgi:hypothetical protein
MNEYTRCLDQCVFHISKYVESYENDEDENNQDAKYQIVMPHIFRAFIILLLNQNLEPQGSYRECQTLIQLMASLIGAYKDSELYLERYLIQVS